MSIRIMKRNGQLQEFDENKIRRAVTLAFADGDETYTNHQIVQIVQHVGTALVPNNAGILEIEAIQDQVEKSLMVLGHEDVAKRYILYRNARKKARAVRERPDPLGPANYIHFSKYARYEATRGRRELYEETVKRVEDMHIRRYPHIEAEIRHVFKQVYAKRVLPSMRSMQFAGKAIEVNNARMYNCSYTLVDRPRVFAEIFWLLLSGSGVGFSVQWQHVEKLPPLKFLDRKKVVHHVVADTIEGWGDALNALVDGAIEGYTVEFAYHLIRGEGAPLRTTGGLAPGHIPLRDALENIRKVLTSAQGRQLRPIEAHDIICYSAEGVLAGGIRRSSLISIFSPHDTEMLYCKTPGAFDPDRGVNGQRQMANNSAAFLRQTVVRGEFERVIRIAQASYGDPGFFFTDNLDYGTNPCGEIGLHPVFDGASGFSFCNLTTINAALCVTAQDLITAAQAASFIGTLQAGYTDFPYLTAVTKFIAEQDALIGVSMTGMMDAPDVAFDPAVQRRAAMEVVTTNIETAKLIGIRPAQRCTTIKPEGTSSWELGGVGSGCHPRHARRFFRRFTANPNESVAKYFAKFNPHMVETKPNGDLSIVFPIQTADGSITVKELAALSFLDKVFSTYENWIRPGTCSDRSPGLTHNVSCTVTVRDEEVTEVIEAVWKNRHRIAAMSFAPHSLDKKFPFAPNEAVENEADEAKWNYLIKNYVPVPWDQMVEVGNDGYRENLEPACAGGVCERP